MRRLLVVFALLSLAAPHALAQDGGSCPAADPGTGVSELGETLQTITAPQSFDIGNDTAVRAQDLRAQDELHATCYDDGDSCPGGCDAHVVANGRTNGTARYHAPGSSPGDWQDCRNGQDCEVCFGDDPDDCITVTHRGSGPDAGRADFTASFWAELCAVNDLPEELDEQCDHIEQNSERLDAVSCLENPSYPGCEDLVPSEEEVAAARQAVEDCLERENGNWRCHYRGRNGTLSQGTCENGAVNSSGWDCCTGDRFHDACVTGCGRYYVEAQEGVPTAAPATNAGEGLTPSRDEGTVEPAIEPNTAPATEPAPPLAAEPAPAPTAEPAAVPAVRPSYERPPPRPRWRPLRERRPRPRWR